MKSCPNLVTIFPMPISAAIRKDLSLSFTETMNSTQGRNEFGSSVPWANKQTQDLACGWLVCALLASKWYARVCWQRILLFSLIKWQFESTKMRVLSPSFLSLANCENFLASQLTEILEPSHSPHCRSPWQSTQTQGLKAQIWECIWPNWLHEHFKTSDSAILSFRRGAWHDWMHVFSRAGDRENIGQALGVPLSTLASWSYTMDPG